MPTSEKIKERVERREKRLKAENLEKENVDKKYYKENVISPQISTVLNQIINEKLSDNVKNLYLKGKIFELLWMYFNESDDLNI